MRDSCGTVADFLGSAGREGGGLFFYGLGVDLRFVAGVRDGWVGKGEWFVVGWEWGMAYRVWFKQ